MTQEYNIITEFRLKRRARDIQFFVYDLPVRNIADEHKENASLVYKLQKANNNQLIDFNETLIGSFCKIDSWCGTKVNATDNNPRTIDLSNEKERALLGRLIKREIILSANKTCYKNIKGKYLMFNESTWKDNNIDIHKTVYVDVNIGTDGYIVVGINMKHRIMSLVTLDKEIAAGNIKAGDEVEDRNCESYYEYVGAAPFTISERNEYMNQSIIEYYEQKGQSYRVRGVPKDTKAVLVKGSKGTVLPYIPSFLHKVIRMENLPYNANKALKMNADKKITATINAAVDLSFTSNIARADDNKERHTTLIKKAMLCENSGYCVCGLKQPQLLFGGGNVLDYSRNNLIHGINRFGPYKKDKADVEIRYFVDNSIIHNDKKYDAVQMLTDEIEKRSANNGVSLKRVRISNKEYYESVNMDDDTSFNLFLLGEVDKGVFESPTLFILTDNHFFTTWDATVS